MIEPVSAYGTRPPTELAHVQFCYTERCPVDSAAQANFENMLHADDTRVAQANNAGVAADLSNGNWVIQPGPAEALPPPSIGEVFVGELQEMREHWQGVQDSIHSAMDEGNLSLDQLMKLSMEFQQSSMMVTLLMNEATALTQEVSKLMRAS